MIEPLRMTFDASARCSTPSISGREVEWGEITVWDPPRRLCYLWYIRTDRADATEVEIRFNHQGADQTRARDRTPAWRPRTRMA